MKKNNIPRLSRSSRHLLVSLYSVGSQEVRWQSYWALERKGLIRWPRRLGNNKKRNGVLTTSGAHVAKMIILERQKYGVWNG
jgi:hypothetical protein